MHRPTITPLRSVILVLMLVAGVVWAMPTRATPELVTSGSMFVQEGSPVRFSCFVQAVTVMTQCQAAAPAGMRNYVTSVTVSNLVATVQGVDVVHGTGANCATAPTALTHKIQMGTNALTTSPFVASLTFDTPLVPPAATAICLRPTAATAFGATVTGFQAP